MGEAPAVVVIVPVLGRPEQMQPLADSLDASDPNDLCRLLFVVGRDDPEAEAACEATGADLLRVEWSRQPGDYQRKINAAAARTDEEWLFTAATDLVFHPGWITHALRTGRAHPPGVVGTNDLGNPMVRRGRMSTHSLVHREYLQMAVIDRPGILYCEEYDHNYCDMELVDYAKFQRRWSFAMRAHVEHLHPDWRKGKDDPTYRVSKARFRPDQKLWMQRQRLWRGATPAERRAEARRRIHRGDPSSPQHPARRTTGR